jgi:hypothetical protein
MKIDELIQYLLGRISESMAPHKAVPTNNQTKRTVARFWAGRPELDSQQGRDIFLFSTASGPVLGPTRLL